MSGSPPFKIGPITVTSPTAPISNTPGSSAELVQMARAWGVPQDPRLLSLWRTLGPSYPYAKYDWQVITNTPYPLHELFGQPILADAGDLYGDAFIGGWFNQQDVSPLDYLIMLQQTQVGPLKDHFRLTGTAWEYKGDPFFTPGAIIYHFINEDIRADTQQIIAWAARGKIIKNQHTAGSFWTDSLRPLFEAAAIMIGAYYGATYLAGLSWGNGASAGAGQAAAGAGGAAVGSAGASGAGAAAAAGGQTSAILADVQAFVAQAQKAIEPVASAISSGVHTISSIVGTINNGLVQPIVGPIASIIQEVGAIKDFVHTDLRDGIKGILALPGDLAGAISSVDATMQRAVLSLSASNAQVLNQGLETYGPAMGSLGQGKIADSFDRVLPVEPGKWEAPKRGELTDPGKVTEALASAQAVMDKLASDQSWYARLAHYFFSVVDSGNFIIQYNKPFLDLIAEAGRKRIPVGRLSPADVVRAWRMGELDEASARDELLGQGLDGSRQDAMYELSRVLPGAQDFIDWLRRGLLTPAEFTSALQVLGYEPEDVKRYQDAAVALVDADRALTWWHRQLLTEDDLNKVLAAQGFDAGQQERLKAASYALPGLQDWLIAFDRELALQQNPQANLLADSVPKAFLAAAARIGIGSADASLLWANHEQLLPPQQAIQSYFRGFINQTQLHAFLRAFGYAPGMADNLVDSQRPQIEYRSMTLLLANGIIDEVTAKGMLKEHGYIDRDVDYILKLAATHKVANASTTATQVQKDTQQTTIALYNQGTIKRDEAETALEHSGMDAELVKAVLDLEDVKNTAAEHATEINTVLSQVQAGQLTADQAHTHLSSFGLTTRELAAAGARLNTLTRTRLKLPAEATLLKMYQLQIINRADTSAALVASGYSTTWAERLILVEEAQHGTTKQ